MPLEIRRIDGDEVEKGSAWEITLSDVQNPRYAVVPGNFKITTLSPDLFEIDSRCGRIPQQYSESTFQAASVTFGHSCGLYQSYVYCKCNNYESIPKKDRSAIITFPPNYGLEGAFVVSDNMPGEVSVAVYASTSYINVTRMGADDDDMAEGSTISMKFSGIRNPLTTGSIGTFGVSLRTRLNQTTDEKLDIQAQGDIAPGH